MSFKALAMAVTFAFACSGEEINLFDSKGKAIAYIVDDGTIYAWGGRPLAYLYSDSREGFNVYGFNGKHLGWFVKGIIRDHEGDAACGVREVVKNAESPPFKSFKDFKPFKSFREFAPTRPTFSRSWSDAPCGLLLLEGAEE